MAVEIIHNNYGKSLIRLMKVARNGERHEIQEITVKVSFEGEFKAVHEVGDNSLVLPTDTMKNTVYALAHQTTEIEEIEIFGLRLSEHFLTNNAQAARVTVEIVEHGWTRIDVKGESHEHSFVKNADEKRTTKISRTREDAVTVESGIENLIVLKTTKSGFSGFVKDRYTTLPETSDRIFSTAITANWRCIDAENATRELSSGARQTIVETFAGHDSLSVQHTLYAIGEAILEKFADISEISFSMPNIHYLPVDFTRFGLENDNRIFLPTSEPHGLIEARLSR